MLKILFPILLLFYSLPLMAQDKQVTLDVFPSTNVVKVGESFDIAIRQNIVDGWHTYWINAGDSGEPMTIKWDTVEGVSYSDIAEPTPYRINYDPLVNFGHKGNPIFIQTISIADDYKGDEITLNGRALWLVCEEICIPEEQNISLSIPVGDNGNAINQRLFDDARAKMPMDVDWASAYSRNGDQFALNISVPAHLHNQMTDVEIYPITWGFIKTTSPITADISDNGITFTGHADNRDLSTFDSSEFVIKTAMQSYQITADLQTSVSNTSVESQSLLFILVFAFIGGLILNLMPCVFPVLSMKAISLVKLSDKEKSHARASGLSYTAGIVLSFVAIAGLLIILKGAGETIGWGFQLQNPYVVMGLATLLFLLGLNLMGLFEINGRFTSVGSNLTSGNSNRASFFTGVLATLVATPCTAPFMASAIGYALTQNALIGLSVFAMLGFGLAFPYLLLTFVPAVQKILPKPGVWMDTFKQALAWPMFASAIWLVWVLAQQAGDMAIIYILGLFLAIIFIIWFFKKSSSKIWRVIISAFLIGIFIGYASILSPKSDMNYEAYSPAKLESVLNENPNQPVFVNMTAAWCITCLVNERTSLSNADVVETFDKNNVIYLKGDWTNRDSEITKFLESYGRNGVPLYIFYSEVDEMGKRPDPILLPQILTPTIVMNIIQGE